ncbi:MAG: type VI secretion system ATPase TssH [Leptolyngbya sp. PLA3]|nr:MAG: type VI secretion system ATPase TssH [Cyanobacteria bacterium CYA]MCE7969171.1 type VI secretion system ATPase TssH [Leptolyngbya sp. PL-A3]
MAEISLKSLFGKMNSLCYKSAESATVFCKMRGNPRVDVVHFIHQVLQLQDSDLHKIIRHFQLNPSRLATDLTAALDSIQRGAVSIAGFSSDLEEAVERAWVYGSLMFNERSIRSGHLIIGMLKTKSLSRILMGISEEFSKIRVDELCEAYEKILGDSPESKLAARERGGVGGGAVPGEASGAMAPAEMGKEEALKRFCRDMTEEARTGKIDPIVGRDEETRQVIDILMRRRQNNPVLVGEAGVGKTAVAEGFAHKIVEGDVPPPLQGVRLLELDVSALQAGASMKGEFEQRLKQVIEEVQASTKPTILFIDEVHRLIGAGGQAGTGDAAQLLKPALARGLLRTVAATTWAEYKKHIEKDPALSRRFQTVLVDEPGEDRAILMMRKVAGIFEKHHKVQILDEAIESAVRLSHRYIPARQLPDKAVSLLDTASARVAIGQHAVPAEVDDTRKRIQALETESQILEREQTVGFHHEKRVKEVAEQIKSERERLATLESNWHKEKELVDRVLEIRARLRGPSGSEPVEGTGSQAEADAGARVAAAGKSTLSEAERVALKSELDRVKRELADLQGDSPLIIPDCDASAIAAVVADWTGIPVGRMVKNEIQAILQLADTLNKRVIGQRHGLEAIAKRIQTNRASLDNPNKPIGVFMLAGPSGVGKTESALALAEALYGGEQNVITINMSEFQEAHTVSTLKGAPPGYVGYGEGGVLTEAVRRRPYSVVLLDEVEKAHPDVHEIFFQVFDKGGMEDGEGRHIDFKNTVILLTTNVGTELIMNMCKDPDLMPSVEGLQKSLREPMLKVFPAALLGRITVIPYFPLDHKMLREIARLQLGRIQTRVGQNHGARFEYGDDVLDLIVSRCTEIEFGGRMIDAILTQTMLPEISTAFLNRMMEGRSIERVQVSVEDNQFRYAFE